MAKINVGVITYDNSKWVVSMNQWVGRTTAEDYCASKTSGELSKGRTYYVKTKFVENERAIYVVNDEDIETRSFNGDGTEKTYEITLAPNEVAICINNSEGNAAEIYYNDSANYTPKTPSFSESRPFYFWCQTVLPLVYDDSLSYYELLNKVVKYINNLINDAIALEETNEELVKAYKNLQAYVNNYFDNLDVSYEVSTKLDEMAIAGDFDEIVENVLSTLDYTGIINARVDEDISGVVADQIGGVVTEQIDGVVAEQIGSVVDEQLGAVVDDKIDAVVADQIGNTVAGQIDEVVGEQLPDVTRYQIKDEVEDWMNRNLTDPPIDKTLSLSGAAADAEITGNILSVTKDIEIENYEHYLEQITAGHFHENNLGKVWNEIGELSNQSEYRAVWIKTPNFVGGAKYELKLKATNVEAGYIYENFKKPESVEVDTLEGYSTGEIGTRPSITPLANYKMTFNAHYGDIGTNDVLQITTKVGVGETAIYTTNNAGNIARKFIGDGTTQTFTILIRNEEKTVTVNNSENNEVSIVKKFGNLLSYISDQTGDNPEGTYDFTIPYNCTDLLINAETSYGFTIKLKTNHFNWLGIPYRTTPPSHDYEGTGLGVCVLTSDPATKYEGWIYIITEA